MKIIITHKDGHIEEETVLSKLFVKERHDDFDMSYDSEMFSERLSSHRRIDKDKVLSVAIIFED